jgi:hypothetical protein
MCIRARLLDPLCAGCPTPNGCGKAYPNAMPINTLSKASSLARQVSLNRLSGMPVA